MANTIKVTVVAKNGLNYIDCPQIAHLPCPTGTIIDGNDYYFHSDNFQQSWIYPPFTTAATLPAVSFPVARVQTINGDELFIIADPSGSPSLSVNQIIANACNECCGDTEPEVDATPEDIIPELNPIGQGQTVQNCVDNTCTYNYTDLLPANSAGLLYKVTFSCMGTTVTSTNFSTVAAALAYAIANWSAYGTWTLSGNVLTLTGSYCSSGAIKHILQNQTFTVDIINSPYTTFNEIRNNGFTVEIGSTITPVTVALLIPQIAAYFGGGTLSDAGAGILSYTGTDKPNSFLLDGTVKATWA